MRTLLAALTAAVLLAACASTPAGDGPEVAVEPTPDAGPAPDLAGASVLDFTAATVDGGQLDASSLEGRDVVLWFWAPW